MNCQSLFWRKNKKTVTNFSSADLTQRVVKVKLVAMKSFQAGKKIIIRMYKHDLFAYL